MSLVDIEYHEPCAHYDDGYHRKRSGWYTCECGASSAWHTTTPVPPSVMDSYLQRLKGPVAPERRTEQ